MCHKGIFLENRWGEQCEFGQKNKSAPQKHLKCPASQFPVPNYDYSCHLKETFRFIGNNNIPYTRKGRANDQSRYGEEVQLAHLIKWKAEPLHL